MKEERFISSLGSNKWVDHPLTQRQFGRNGGGPRAEERVMGSGGKGGWKGNGKVWKRDGLG